MEARRVAAEDPEHSNPSCPCFNQNGMQVGLVLLDPTSDQFVPTLLMGANQAAKDRNLNLVVHTAQSFDIGNQEAAISSMVRQGVTSLIVQVPQTVATLPPIPLLKTLSDQGVRIGSIIAGEAFAASPDFRPAFHVGNDNYKSGVLAATKLLSEYPSFAANTVCFNPIAGLANFDQRCSGWVQTMKTAGNTVKQIGAYGIDEANALIQQTVTSGTVRAMFMVGAYKVSAIQTVRSTPGAIGTFLVIPFELDSVTGNELAASDVVVPYIVDTQPYLQGYLAVTLSALYNLTDSGGISTRFFRSGPVIVDRSTPNLSKRVQLQTAGYPVCPSVDHPTICFNRTAAVVNSAMNAQTYSGFWSYVRSGLYAAALDTGVQVVDWLDDSSTDFDMAAYISSMTHNELQRRATSPQGNATTPMIGVVIAAPGTWTKSFTALDALSSTLNNVPTIGINKVLVGSQALHAFDLYLFMSNQEAGRQAAKYIWSRGYTKMTCLHETSIVDWTTSDARCYVAQSTFASLGGHAQYIQIDPQSVASVTPAIERAVANGTQVIFSETSFSLTPTINALRGTGVYGIGTGKVTAASLGATNTLMYDELDAGRYLFGVDQSAFLQGYLPTCLFFVRAVTGGGTDGNWLVADPSATFDGTPVTYPIIESGPVVLTSGGGRLANCSVALNAPPTNLPVGATNILDFTWNYVAWPRCVLRAVNSPSNLPVSTFEFSHGQTAASVAVSALGGFVGVCTLLAIGVYRKRPAMKSGSVRFSALITACSTAILASLFLFAMPPSASLCSVRLAVFSILVTIVLSALFAKMLRVYRVFSNAMSSGKKVDTSDRRVLKEIAIGTSITVLIVVLSLTLDPPDGGAAPVA